MEAWWAHTMILATAIIYALASVQAGGLRGADVLIWTGDREGSGLAPYIWHPDVPRPYPELCGMIHTTNPPEAGMVSWGKTTELGVRNLLALALSVSKVTSGKLYLICGSHFSSVK